MSTCGSDRKVERSWLHVQRTINKGREVLKNGERKALLIVTATLIL